MSETSTLSAIILTKNEEANIVACIHCLKWADKVIVLDSGSTDRTVEFARARGAVTYQHPFRDFAAQRNAALDIVDGDWVLFVDADERVAPKLAAEVRSAIGDPLRVGWWIPRRNYFLGRLMRHTGWYPDYQLRLLKRGRARYDPEVRVHERAILDGESGFVKNPLDHYGYPNLSECRRKLGRYVDFKAEMLLEKGVRPTYHVLASPFFEFTRRFFLMRGWADGVHGFLLSVLMAYYHWRTYMSLWRKRRTANR